MPGFPIVDAHVHLYDPAWLRYSWLESRPAINRPHGLRQFDEERLPVVVDGIVFVEVGVDKGLHLAEAAWAQERADKDARLAAIIAHAPVERGAAVETDLERLQRNRSLRGVRRLIEIEADGGICLEPGFIEGVKRVGRHGLTFDLCVRHWQLVFAIELVRRCPEVTFVLDHIGKPGIRHGLVEPWQSQIAELARLPNLVCKLSGVVTEVDHDDWTKDQLRPYLDHAIACFGFDRLMFGSDWPVSKLTHAYPDWVAIIDETIAGCSEAEALALYRETARRTYRL